MQPTTTLDEDDDASLSQIIYALILALTPFVEAILANAAHHPSPSMRRLAATLRALRAFATLLGITPAATQPAAIQPAATNPARSTPTRTTPYLRLAQMLPPSHRPPAIAHRIAPEPTRTLEL